MALGWCEWVGFCGFSLHYRYPFFLSCFRFSLSLFLISFSSHILWQFSLFAKGVHFSFHIAHLKMLLLYPETWLNSWVGIEFMLEITLLQTFEAITLLFSYFQCAGQLLFLYMCPDFSFDRFEGPSLCSQSSAILQGFALVWIYFHLILLGPPWAFSLRKYMVCTCGKIFLHFFFDAISLQFSLYLILKANYLNIRSLKIIFIAFVSCFQSPWSFQFTFVTITPTFSFSSLLSFWGSLFCFVFLLWYC